MVGVQQQEDVVACSFLVLMPVLFHFTQHNDANISASTRKRDNFLFLCLHLHVHVCLHRPGLHVGFLHVYACSYMQLFLHCTCKAVSNNAARN